MVPIISHPAKGFWRSFAGHSPSIPVGMGGGESGRLPGSSCQDGLLAVGSWHSLFAEMQSFSRAFDGRFKDKQKHGRGSFAAHSLSGIGKHHGLLLLIRCAFAEQSMTTDGAFDGH